ncbi:MAG: pirin-like C-terminal cupin domain-containing protein, partial [Alphaproteobacteria bacterium]
AGADLPHWEERGVTGHLIAGSAFGLTAAARTHSPLFYVHLELAAGAEVEIPNAHAERAVYVARGAVEIDGAGQGAGRMLVLDRNASKLRATEPATVMLLGGDPVGERLIYWNFVSSSEERLAAAVDDWRAGRMKLPDADDAEFIPLPDAPLPKFKSR